MNVNIEFVANDEQMIEEGIFRLKQLNIYPPLIEDFKSGKIWMSKENQFVELNDDMKQLVDGYEKASGNKIYHLVYSELFGCETLNGLCISKYFQEDWDFERPDKIGWTMSYSWNLSHPELTEMGMIRVELKNGVLQRVN